MPYRSLTCHMREDEADSLKEREEEEEKWRFFLFLKSLTDVNQWKIFFCSFSLSLSNHSKLSWSMMMVGSALSFDLDASRLIYTSNTWHFLQEANFFFVLISFIMEINENNNNNNNNNQSSSNNGMYILFSFNSCIYIVYLYFLVYQMYLKLPLLIC